MNSRSPLLGLDFDDLKLTEKMSVNHATKEAERLKYLEGISLILKKYYNNLPNSRNYSSKSNLDISPPLEIQKKYSKHASNLHTSFKRYIKY